MHDSKIDNTKGLLIILVIFGHVLSRNNLIGISYFTYVMINTVHMPLMFIISGYLSGSSLKRTFKENLKLNFRKLLVPFILASFIYILVSHNLLGNKLRADIFLRPPFAMWYLIALFYYRMIIKYFIKIRYRLLLSGFIWFVALYAPPSIFNDYSLYRIFSFQLFFVIGIHIKLYVEKGKFTVSKNKMLGLLATTILLNIIIYKFAGGMTDNFYKMYQANEKILDARYLYPVLKLASLSASLMLSIVVWNSMSKSKNCLTQFGDDSLSYYLIHTIVIIVYTRFVFPIFDGITNSYVGFLSSILITISIIAICKLVIVIRGKIENGIDTAFSSS